MARKKNFTAKLIEDSGIHDKIAAALWGDAALTEGGKMVRRYLEALDWKIRWPAEPSFLEIAAGSITSRLVEGDAKIFREIADFLEKKQAAEKDGPASAAYFLAAHYVEACAWKGKKPTVAEILKYLSRTLPIDAVPDYKTVERMAVRLGAKAPPRRRRR